MERIENSLENGSKEQQDWYYFNEIKTNNEEEIGKENKNEM